MHLHFIWPLKIKRMDACLQITQKFNFWSPLYRQLRARRALSLFNDFLLNSVNSLLVLSPRYSTWIYIPTACIGMYGTILDTDEFFNVSRPDMYNEDHQQRSHALSLNVNRYLKKILTDILSIDLSFSIRMQIMWNNDHHYSEATLWV